MEDQILTPRTLTDRLGALAAWAYYLGLAAFLVVTL